MAHLSISLSFSLSIFNTFFYHNFLYRYESLSLSLGSIKVGGLKIKKTLRPILPSREHPSVQHHKHQLPMPSLKCYRESRRSEMDASHYDPKRHQCIGHR
jgi:hypothetical protein